VAAQEEELIEVPPRDWSGLVDLLTTVFSGEAIAQLLPAVVAKFLCLNQGY